MVGGLRGGFWERKSMLLDRKSPALFPWSCAVLLMHIGPDWHQYIQLPVLGMT